MNPPFTLDDVTDKITREDGGVILSFARHKAAQAILSKMNLAVELFDSREEKPELWYFENGYWHPGGALLIGYFLDTVAGDLSDSQNISDVLRRIRGRLRLNPVEFDITNPYFVGCEDGITLDLQTGIARKSAMSDLISMPIPAKFDPSAKCPEFIKFLDDVAATDDDRLSIIDFQASLLVAKPMDFFAACPGLGSNGRSVYKDFLRAFVGSDACRSIPLKNLSDRFTSGFLTRCSVNFCNETEISGIILEFIKRTSEKMPVEVKFKGMVNALLFLKYFFDTNTMPSIPDTSYGAGRRICTWDLPWRFVDNPNPKNLMEKQRDPDIISKITTAEELSGVLNLVLKRAPVVIKQKMIHHKEDVLQEYVLQSHSGDVFIDLFLDSGGYDDKVHLETIRTAYQKYCITTNSNLLNSKPLKTLIENKLNRYWEKQVKIGQINKSGYKSLKFDTALFDNTIAILEKARAEDRPIFPILLTMFPDLENTVISAKVYQTLPNSTTETTISLLYSRIVDRIDSIVDDSQKKRDCVKSRTVHHRESEVSSEAEKSTFSKNEFKDSGNDGRQGVDQSENSTPNRRMSTLEVVEEFLQDGGRGSLKRFLAEFPQARRPQDDAAGL